MRYLFIIFTVLTILTAVSANDRTKRTIPFIDAFTSSLLGIPKKQSVSENILLYKIPGYDDVLLKVTPKKIPKKKTVPIQIALATNSMQINNARPQNKTCEDEPSGFQQIVDLIKVGIKNKKQFLGKLFGSAPVTPIIVINEQVKYPVIQEIQQPRPSAVGLKYTETVEVDSKQIAVQKALPVVTRPKHVVTQVVQPTYSYKQGSKGGTVTSYEFEDNPNLIVTETVAMPALPPYIKSRFEEIVGPVRPIAPVAVETDLMRVPGAVISEGIVFGPTIIPGNVIRPLPLVPPPIYPPAFARLQNMGYFEGGDFYGPPILVEEDIPVLLRSHTDIFKMTGPKGEVNVKITKNKSPISVDSKVSTESSPSKVNLRTNMNSGVGSTPGGLSKTIPPPPSLSNIAYNSDFNLKATAKSPISQRPANNVNNEISGNNMVTDDNKGSSFVYKQVSNKNMQPLDISLAAPNNNNLGNKNGGIDDIASRMSNYYYVPPVGNVEPPPINIQRTSVPSQKTQVNNMGTLRPCLDTNQLIKSTVCPEPFYRNDGSLKSSPIVVSDGSSFVYKQMNVDGSSMSMMGSQNNVVVDVKEKKSQDNRGDIPQMSLYK